MENGNPHGERLSNGTCVCVCVGVQMCVNDCRSVCFCSCALTRVITNTISCTGHVCVSCSGCLEDEGHSKSMSSSSSSLHRHMDSHHTQVNTHKHTHPQTVMFVWLLVGTEHSVPPTIIPVNTYSFPRECPVVYTRLPPPSRLVISLVKLPSFLWPKPRYMNNHLFVCI